MKKAGKTYPYAQHVKKNKMIENSNHAHHCHLKILFLRSSFLFINKKNKNDSNKIIRNSHIFHKVSTST